VTPDDRDRLRELAEVAWSAIARAAPSDAVGEFRLTFDPPTVLALLDDLRDAEARVARAVDAFNRYGRHGGGCDYRWSGECTCGLLAYRAALAPDETGGAGG
jgi:hypothetical protein